MRRRWMRGSLGAALAWCAIAPTALALPDAARLIVPGKAIGPVSLGATLAEVEGKIGRADDIRVIDSNHALMQWREQALVVGVEEDRVVLVGTNSNRYQTSTGLRVGVPGDHALVMFPGLKAPKVQGIFGLADDVMGINFLCNPSKASRTPSKTNALQEGWLIDEINVYQFTSEPVIDRQKP